MSKPRLLLAEDDEALSALLDEYLSGAGYDISLFYRGDDALKALQSEHFDVVLTDIVMPGVDGLSLLAASNQDPARTLVLLMTAYSGIEDAIHAIEQGAYDFVSKPFQLPEIRVRLDNATRYQSLLRQWNSREELNISDNPKGFVPFYQTSPNMPAPAAIKAYGIAKG